MAVQRLCLCYYCWIVRKRVTGRFSYLGWELFVYGLGFPKGAVR